MTAPENQDARLSAAPALRNREPIAQVLRHALPTHGTVLEIASGSGEHVLHFARQFPALDWQPSDISSAALRSIAAWCADAGLANIRPPLRLDAGQPAAWPIARADAVLAINMVHISPWSSTAGLFAGAARILPPEAPIILYGPYLEAEVPTTQSNRDFDAWLKARDPQWGLRQRSAVEELAATQHFHLAERHSLPANNLLLVFR